MSEILKLLKPTVIVMNPPFSTSVGVKSTNKTSNGAKHIEQALTRLQPNGRLVAIVGEGMAADKPAFKAWWKEIQSRYNVRANIGITDLQDIKNDRVRAAQSTSVEPASRRDNETGKNTVQSETPVGGSKTDAMAARERNSSSQGNG